MSEEVFDLVKGSMGHRRHAAHSQERKEPSPQEVEELFCERITPETDLPPMQPLFKIFDVPCPHRARVIDKNSKQ